jgi:hypothetical protein
MARLHPVVIAVGLAFAALVACGQSGTLAQSSNQALATAAAQAWSGTIKITQAASATSSQKDVIHSSTTLQAVTNDVFITVTKGLAVAEIKFESRDNTDIADQYDGYRVLGKISEVTTASGSNRKDASVKVSIYDDGRYEIEYDSGGITGKYVKVQTTQTVCASKSDPNCTDSSSQTNDSADPTKLGFVAGGVDGTLKPAELKAGPRQLSGSITEPFDVFSGSPPGKTTITWNLTR